MSAADSDAGGCRNCGAGGTGAYCSSCGQRRELRDLDLRELSRDLAENLFNFDSAAWRTFLELTWRPGHVARAYIHGQRRRYINPVKYFVFALAAWLLLLSALGLSATDLASAKVTVDAGEDLQGEAAAAVRAFFDQHLRLLAMLGVPVYAWVLGALFRERGYRFVERCVFLLFAFAQVTLLVRVPVSFVSLLGWPVLFASVPLQLAYLAWAVRDFFATRLVWGLVAMGAGLLTWFSFLLLVVAGCLVLALQLAGG